MPSVKERHPISRIETTYRQTDISALNDAHEKAWAALLATQTRSWRRLVDTQIAEYDQACARQIGLVSEVALLRGQLQKLVSVDRQHEQEKEDLRSCQARERTSLYVSL